MVERKLQHIHVGNTIDPPPTHRCLDVNVGLFYVKLRSGDPQQTRDVDPVLA